MKRNVIIFICAWSILFFAWALADPPNGPVGETFGKIAVDTLGNVGIATNTPATLLDINGTTTIRKSLDMTGNRIINVATPTSSMDAVNKAYADTQMAAISSVATMLWGNGRPNVGVLTVLGVCGGTSECYKDMDASASCNIGDIKIARSDRISTWDRSPAVCPANWRVCSAAERDINGTGTGYGSCGSVTRRIITCDPPATLHDELFVIAASAWAWVSDPATDIVNSYYGRIIPTTGTYTDDVSNRDEICAMMPVWCCSSY
jgi:hypothetical protein